MRALSLVSGGTSGEDTLPCDFRLLQVTPALVSGSCNHPPLAAPSSSHRQDQCSPFVDHPQLVRVEHPRTIVIHPLQWLAAVGSLQQSCHSPCSSRCPGRIQLG